MTSRDKGVFIFSGVTWINFDWCKLRNLLASQNGIEERSDRPRGPLVPASSSMSGLMSLLLLHSYLLWEGGGNEAWQPATEAESNNQDIRAK